MKQGSRSRDYCGLPSGGAAADPSGYLWKKFGYVSEGQISVSDDAFYLFTENNQQRTGADKGNPTV